MYNRDMKSLVKYAIELDICNIRTFDGYKGGDILCIESYDKDVVVKIKAFCHRLEVDTNIKRGKDNSYRIFCAFGVDRFAFSGDDSVYELK